jgi:catalase
LSARIYTGRRCESNCAGAGGAGQFGRGAPVEIVKRQVVHFHRAEPAYGAGVAKRMGVPVPEELKAVE